MEDLSRDMEKALNPPGSAPRQKPTGWTLLLIGDRGRILRISKFRAWLLFGSTLLLISSAAASSLYYLYRFVQEENRALESALQSSRAKVKSLRDEKDILMARLFRVESQLSAPVKKIQEKKVEPSPKMPQETEENDEESVSESVEDARENPAKAATAPLPVAPGILNPNQTATLIEVDDFFALPEPGSNTLRIKYKIRNVHPQSAPVSGRTFIILKPHESVTDHWLILPSVPMESGKPTVIKDGRSFSITRFKTIRFKAPYKEGPAPFATASILVYGSTGELLMEKQFPIESVEMESTPSG